ncbi:MAG: MFS transporter [Anaerolineales bacterium]|nr:MFS transporter [Anaerolineales bacterium]
MTADIIPLEGRGRYFAARNIVMAIAGMLCVYLAGEWITRAGQPVGYQMVLAAAFVLGMISTFSFSRLSEPPPGPIPYPKTPLAPVKIWQEVRSYPAFLALAGTAALWNFSLNLAGPFFNIYMVEALSASPAFVGIASIVSSLAGMFAQKKSGELADRWGPRRVQLISGLLIPIMPIFWVFINQPWQTLPVNIVAGVLWAAYSLSSFNLLLVLTPAEQRARYSAIYQVIVTVSLAAGAAVGGLMVENWGYPAIFIASGAGRLLAALLFASFVPAILKK